MPLFEGTDRRFFNLEVKTRVFVACALAAIILLVLLIGVQHGIFIPKQGIFFMTNSAGDISTSQAVSLSGFQIGKVSNITMEDAGKIRVDLLIEKKYMKWIHTDSVVHLAGSGLIGGKKLEIIPGSPAAPQVHAGGQLEFKKSGKLEDTIADLKNKVEFTLSRVNGIIAYVNDPDGDIKKSLRNVQAVTAGLKKTELDADRLMAKAGGSLDSVSSKINALADSGGHMIKNADMAVRQINKNLPVMLKEANKSMQNLQAATGEIKKIAQDSSGKIPALLQKGSALEDNALQITGSLKKTWPISTHIKKKKEQTIQEDSYE